MPKIALAQIKNIPASKKRNIEKIEKTLLEAAKKECDLVIFPELSVTGYVLKDLVYSLAEEIPGPSTEKLQNLANDYGVYIIAGLPERGERHLIYNSAVLIGPEGLLGIYRKKHLPTYGLFEEGRYFTPWMKDIEVFETPVGKIGILICFDLFFPELARILTIKGAEIIAVLSAAPDISRQFFETFVHARALENTVFVAYVNMVGFYDGVGFFGGSHLRGPLGQLISHAKLYEEDLVIADVDYDAVIRARTIRPILKDLRIDDIKYLYHALTE
ncbi:MAG: carbon-nitrogen hydrolase family protein [Thermoprotei archaeon]|nr:MAG: carbon-nitrogen hydrolase family protein [Thermoprotei archaeon]